MSKKYRGFEDGGRETIGPSISVCCDGGVAAISDLQSISLTFFVPFFSYERRFGSLFSGYMYVSRT
jgi:hypothetical protein